MAGILTNSDLIKEYTSLFSSCVINNDKIDLVEETIKRLLKHKPRYEVISPKVPWYVVGLIHLMECNSNFDCHLHNGDPLTKKTVRVPAGRPLKGEGPFTWEQSAEDALAHMGILSWKDWSLPGILFILEKYNGTGYRRHGIKSPYLWSFSNHYKSGKYIKDGIWSDTAVSKQIGAAVILRRMCEKRIIALFPIESAPSVKVVYEPAIYSKAIECLQIFLNTQGAFLRVDGKAGKETSEAFRAFSGYYLQGDPRQVAQ